MSASVRGAWVLYPAKDSADSAARDYRRTIKRSLGQHSRTRVEKVMMLLVESGLIYAAIWVRRAVDLGVREGG